MSRGRKMTVQGSARRCAEAVIFHEKSRGFNWRYQMRHFGDALEGHLRYIKENSLEMTAPVASKVERAILLLKQECDGKDCSYQEGCDDKEQKMKEPTGVVLVRLSIEKIIRWSEDAIDQAVNYRVEKKLSYTDWMVHDFERIAMNEAARDIWKGILKGIDERIQTFSKDGEEAITKGVKEYLRETWKWLNERVMTSHLSRSTNSLSNYADALKIDVMKLVAGISLVRSDSLYQIYHEVFGELINKEG